MIKIINESGEKYKPYPKLMVGLVSGDIYLCVDKSNGFNLKSGVDFCKCSFNDKDLYEDYNEEVVLKND